MRKQEIGELLIRLFSCVDQADIQDDVYELMKAAPIAMQKDFIEMLVTASNIWDREPHDADLYVARKLVGL
ncbi:hypothetical protein JCM10914A_56040 [Paenibacillus sp. JCM 10914]|uniref:hypothetical protein n=1 Tax=Paenibacillus sp. JCM 10914 TaxID=1236974 RepID=UPI0003CC5CDF|nr:hypothetical protein [Paenibacillus sp. JCM 10914]GAE09598.1 hypothetical protein JCM10914_5966 [Paenibacillus sp. JCM 10914]